MKTAIVFIIALVAFGYYQDANAARTKPVTFSKNGFGQDSQGNTIRLYKAVYETVSDSPSTNAVARYTTRVTAALASSMVKMAKGAFGGPAGVAFTAGLLVYDYFYDPTDDTIYQGEPATALPSGTGDFDVRQNESSGWGNLCGGTFDYCYNHWLNNSGWPSILPLWQFRPHSDPINPYTNDDYADPTPASDQDIFDDVLTPNDDLSYDVVEESVKSGNWPTEWPEAKDIADEISRSLAPEVDGTPADGTEDQTIIDSSTNNYNSSVNRTEQTAIEFPVFCEWAGVVCDFIDWVQEPWDAEDTPVPFEDIAQPSGFTMSGAEYCPAPVVITLMGEQSMSYSYQPACDFMNMIRPFVLAIASFAAAFILLGAGRSD